MRLHEGDMMSILYPVMTEKAIGMIERSNTLTFIVETIATKAQVRDEVEKRFAVKVARVNTLNTLDGRKKAFVKLTKDFKADDVAAKLKIA